MSPVYKAKTFDPSSREPFRVSRSKIDLFMECQRCFWLDQKLGVKRPDMPTFTLNNAVDELLKREFDIHRAKGTKHPLLKAYGIDAAPFAHADLEKWRDALRRGIEYVHPKTNLSVRGGIDDVWITPGKELIIVDYKATSKRKEIELYESYKRQVEVYQWLFRRNGFKVSDTAYFVYVNGNADAPSFDGKLEFDVQLIPHKGDDSWVEPALMRMRAALESDEIPPVGKGFGGGRCDYCSYREAAGEKFQALAKKKPLGHTVKPKPPSKNHARTLFD